MIGAVHLWVSIPIGAIGIGFSDVVVGRPLSHVGVVEAVGSEGLALSGSSEPLTPMGSVVALWSVVAALLSVVALCSIPGIPIGSEGICFSNMVIIGLWSYIGVVETVARCRSYRQSNKQDQLQHIV